MACHLNPVATLVQRLRSQLRHSPTAGAELLTLTLANPGLRLAGLPELQGDWFYWGRPAEGRYLFGMGSLLRIEDSGKGRLKRLTQAFIGQCAGWQHRDPDASGFQATAFAGFAFADGDAMQGNWAGMPNTCIQIPELLLQQQGDASALSVSFRPRELDNEALLSRWQRLLEQLCNGLKDAKPAFDQRSTLNRIAHLPEESDWLHLVANATTAIRCGKLEKVVPVRQVRIHAGRQLHPGRLMAALDRYYPESMLFASRLAGRVFMAASPERLVARRGGMLMCDAVGGTTHRSLDPAQDQALGRALLRDRKSRHEHVLVVESIAHKLRGLCRGLQIPARPGLIRLRHLQHLKTAISGRANPGVNLLQAAAHLHPTAAVSGSPPRPAREWLGRYESTQRGWYTGAAGWLNRQGDGELAVLLRCALLERDQAELFAGAGITADSEPLAELRETELKFEAMLEALEYA